MFKPISLVAQMITVDLHVNVWRALLDCYNTQTALVVKYGSGYQLAEQYC